MYSSVVSDSALLQEGSEEIKELPADYILVTYDLPATAKALRRKFIEKAYSFGAMMHTASCYLLPASDQALALAEELSKMANVVVWKANVPDKQKALEIHTSYDKQLKVRCTAIKQRMAIIQEYLESGKVGMVDKMMVKTKKMLQEIIKISEHYQEEWFLQDILMLKDYWEAIYGTPKSTFGTS